MNAKMILKSRPEADIVKATTSPCSRIGAVILAEMLGCVYGAACKALLAAGWKSGPAEDFVLALDSLQAKAFRKAGIVPVELDSSWGCPRRAPSHKDVTANDFFDAAGRYVKEDEAKLRHDVVAAAFRMARICVRAEEARNYPVLWAVRTALGCMEEVADRLQHSPSGFCVDEDAAARHFSI